MTVEKNKILIDCSDKMKNTVNKIRGLFKSNITERSTQCKFTSLSSVTLWVPSETDRDSSDKIVHASQLAKSSSSYIISDILNL